MTTKHAVHYSSARTGAASKDEWRTPPELFRALDEEFGFMLDAAASAENALCHAYFSSKDDALTQPWGLRHVFFNPPYSRLREFLRKAHHESILGTVSVGLVPARTDTRAWHDHVMAGASEVRLLKGRVRFLNPAGERLLSAPFPSAIVVFRPGRRGQWPKFVGWEAPR